jgi:hypothetical protein
VSAVAADYGNKIVSLPDPGTSKRLLVSRSVNIGTEIRASSRRLGRSVINAAEN